jgi:hypothetical protein
VSCAKQFLVKKNVMFLSMWRCSGLRYRVRKYVSANQRFGGTCFYHLPVRNACWTTTCSISITNNWGIFSLWTV